MEQENSSNTAHSGPSQVDRGQVGVIVLIVLAVIATVVMLLSNSEVALRLALLASLWSAVIGFFLVTRYRRQAQSAEQRVADHERFMRQQQESAEGAVSGLPAQQTRADGSTGVDAERFEEMWASIRAELTVIRTHLEELQEREFGYEPAALQAEARRIWELEQQTDRAGSEFAGSEFASSAFSYQQPGGQNNGGVGFASGSGIPSQEAIAGKLGSQPSQPQPNPLSALISEREQEKRQQQARQQTAKQTSKPAHKPADQQTEKHKPAAKPQASAGKAASAAAEPKRSAAKQHDAAHTSDPVFDTSRFHAVRWDSVGEERKESPSQNTGQRTSAVKSEREQSAATTARTNTARTTTVRDDSNKQGAGSHAAPQQPQVAANEQRNDDESRTRRRRRDENTGGISVAELLKRSKK
ncbi:hypothetical protein QP937_09065 [Corynebacterium pseudodiphtheriticum]|uniref:DUF6779 domain-containing protein n=1 Tax=Corynebacterium pseudodiphtheriticum TaxID=37637 RepID=UPI00254D82FE|nr:DUF6779 domain-containing protein [Corynebacterium pseudodiphtheriticum]MDK8478295.1 hypothetical protein [Corynebacterium pseudodiphtheriticum]MDK8487264.1 hypothetical protein [Corynebacterium pseudodiphtheriticum]MDK8494556.1 hypothetical protein [Corynebacterium pseudodiphtheriticum]